jgi:biopolymer transport protein ExbD
MNFLRNSTPIEASQMRLPLIAMIDVVLFLLFYFMIAGTMAAEESDLSATIRTQAAATSGVGESGALAIRIVMSNGQPVFRIGEREFADRDSLAAVLSQLPKTSGVVVRASGDVPVSAAAAALQACKNAGFIKVSYVPVK